MHITFNGEEKSLNEGTYLSQLLEQLGIEGKRIAIEINREIIPKSAHAQYEIKDGDNIEIVHAIGGGWALVIIQWTMIAHRAIRYRNINFIFKI